MAARTFTIEPIGPFSLAEAATFGFGQRGGGEWDGVMRLAFCLDGYARQVGVEVRQDDAGRVQCTAVGADESDLGAVSGQVARVLSLDHDGEEFTRIGQRDPVIGRLQAIAPGLRPPLFYSPYEAAAWSVLSARRPAGQMMAVRAKLSEAHGAVFDLAGQSLAAFPAPEALLAVESFPAIPAEKLTRLHAVAQAALSGQLDAARLVAMGPDAAIEDLQSIKGIGPFYASLIVIRGTGFADVLPAAEPKALSLAARLYNRGKPLTVDELRVIAEPWRPLRTWAVVLIRAAGPRLLGDPPDPASRTRSRLVEDAAPAPGTSGTVPSADRRASRNSRPEPASSASGR